MANAAKKTLCFSCIFVLTLCAIPLIPSSAAHALSDAVLQQTMRGILEWAKKGYDTVLNDNFLRAAGQTGGDWFPIGMGRYGYRENEDYNRYLSVVTANVKKRFEQDGVLDGAKATEWQRIALAVTAMGGDPRNVAGHDLIAEGTYDCQLPLGIAGQGINGPIWGLITLDSMAYEVPPGARYTRDSLLAMIISCQLSDGGFAMIDMPMDESVASQTKNGLFYDTSGSITDVDITGMALQALAPYYYYDKMFSTATGLKTVGQVVDEALSCLSKRQGSEGDYFSYSTYNVESTVQVLVALCSLGIDPLKDTRFIKNGNSVIDGVMKYQHESGGFVHAWDVDPSNPFAESGSPNNMASEQTLYGLVAYWRFTNGMRNLYDFRPETDESALRLLVDEQPYAIAFHRNTHMYTMSIPSLASQISIHNLPIGPYETSDAATGDTVNPVTPFTFTITSRDRTETLEYTIVFSASDNAEIDALIRGIAALPTLVSLENTTALQNLYDRYHTLTPAQQQLITNADVLLAAYDALMALQNEENTRLRTLQNQLLQALDDLPNPISIDEEMQVDMLLGQLEQLGDFSGKDTARVNAAIAAVKVLVSTIADMKKQVAALDQLIWDSINPLVPPTLKDKSMIDGLLTQYKAISLKNRAYLQYSADLLNAEKIIHSLGLGIIPKEVFSALAGSATTYTYEGVVDGKNPYTISFVGTDVKGAADVDATLSFLSSNSSKIAKLAASPKILSLAHDGSLPAKITVVVDTGLTDGAYNLYFFDSSKNSADYISKIQVVDGKATFTIDHASDYFLAKNLTSANTDSNPNDNTGGSQTGNTNTNNTDDTSDTSVKKNESKLGADFVYTYTDTIPKKVFESIKGIDATIKVTGKTTTGTTATFHFNGQDVKTPADFNAGFEMSSTYDEEIEQLADKPYVVFSLKQSGTFPGKAMMELSVPDLDAGEYLLLKYDPAAKKASVVQKVQVTDHKVKFLLETGGHYFITKRAITEPFTASVADTTKPVSADYTSTPSGATAGTSSGSTPVRSGGTGSGAGSGSRTGSGGSSNTGETLEPEDELPPDVAPYSGLLTLDEWDEFLNQDKEASTELLSPRESMQFTREQARVLLVSAFRYRQRDNGSVLPMAAMLFGIVLLAASLCVLSYKGISFDPAHVMHKRSDPCEKTADTSLEPDPVVVDDNGYDGQRMRATTQP